MLLRRFWPMLCLFCASCHALPGPDAGAAQSRARALWEQGQVAMGQGQVAQAIRCYQESLAVDSSFSRNHLSLAAAYLETGKEAEACRHLAGYLQAHPEQANLRAHYGELLCRLHRTEEARWEWQRLVEEAQEKSDLPALIHGHGRLFSLADDEGDDYLSHLERGMGFYWLARRLAELEGGDEEMPAEGLLWKAVLELNQARALRPQEARPCWYLYTAWRELGQGQRAGRYLKRASHLAFFSYLSPVEKRRLDLAERCQEKKP